MVTHGQPQRDAAALDRIDTARSAGENRTPGRASEGGANMETFAVTVFPVAKPDEWRAWVDSIANGGWASSGSTSAIRRARLAM